VYTRTGGGNRLYYDSEETCRQNYPEYFNDSVIAEDLPSGPWNANLRLLPTYVSDEDDDYDCTFAKFYFNMPDKYIELISNLEVQNKTSLERWTKVLEELQAPESKDDPKVQRIMAVLAPVIHEITKHQ
jgi:hypothetical protein